MDTTVNQQKELTFDMATAEIHAHERAIATALSNQANAGDTSAWAIADLYKKGSGFAGEIEPNAREAARAEFLGRYAAWRAQYALLVGPIATELGHPTPGETFAVAAAQPIANGASDLFAAPAPAVEAPAPPSAAETMAKNLAAATTDEARVAAASPTNTRGNGKRRTLSQKDTVKLTQAMTLPAAANTTVQDRAAWFVSNVRNDMTIDDVLSKAVELELIDPQVTGGTTNYELSESDKRVLKSRLLGTLLDPNVTDPKLRVAAYKYCVTELREIIKELMG